MNFSFFSFRFVIIICVNSLNIIFAKSTKTSHDFSYHVTNVPGSGSFIASFGDREHKCPYPVLKHNGSEMAIDVDGFLSGVAEIKFNGAFGNMETKRYCKIKCINGEWVGPLCLVEGGSEASGDGRFYPVFRNCNSQIFHSKFIISFQNKTVISSREFPHDSVVQVRCKKFGVFKLIGDAHLKCHNGVWKHRLPHCIPTSSLSNFTDESAPPSVLAKVTSGSVSIEPTGELAVYPGSTVHLECLYPRSAGEPEWSWTSTYQTYTTGWSIDAAERDWKFRLSIYYVKPQDTGIYTCSTPKGLTHSVILNVIEIHCDVNQVLTTDPNLLTQIQGSRLGQSTTYQCREGFKLNGTSGITCQSSGVWSGNPPQCVPIVCPVLEVQNNTVKLVKQDFGFGGTAIFQCPPGHKLLGVGTLVCLISGEWSGKVPDCKEVLCPPPLIPQNGKLEYGNESAKFPYRVGSELNFSCKGNHTMTGKETIRCQESGVWSSPPPFCKPYCSHPGDPPQGRYTPRKAHYDVSERISLLCSVGHEPSSKVKPKCQKNGSWSEVGLECNAKKSERFSEGRKAENVIIFSKLSTTSGKGATVAATLLASTTSSTTLSTNPSNTASTTTSKTPTDDSSSTPDTLTADYDEETPPHEAEVVSYAEEDTSVTFPHF